MSELSALFQMPVLDHLRAGGAKLRSANRPQVRKIDSATRYAFKNPGQGFSGCTFGPSNLLADVPFDAIKREIHAHRGRSRVFGLKFLVHWSSSTIRP